MFLTGWILCSLIDTVVFLTALELDCLEIDRSNNWIYFFFFFFEELTRGAVPLVAAGLHQPTWQEALELAPQVPLDLLTPVAELVT